MGLAVEIFSYHFENGSTFHVVECIGDVNFEKTTTPRITTPPNARPSDCVS